jgi:hypothetical protein
MEIFKAEAKPEVPPPGKGEVVARNADRRVHLSNFQGDKVSCGLVGTY